jgi:hypothetical protein
MARTGAKRAARRRSRIARPFEGERDVTTRGSGQTAWLKQNLWVSLAVRVEVNCRRGFRSVPDNYWDQGNNRARSSARPCDRKHNPAVSCGRWFESYSGLKAKVVVAAGPPPGRSPRGPPAQESPSSHSSFFFTLYTMDNNTTDTRDAPSVSDGASDIGPAQVPPLWRIFTVDDGTWDAAALELTHSGLAHVDCPPGHSRRKLCYALAGILPPPVLQAYWALPHSG